MFSSPFPASMLRLPPFFFRSIRFALALLRLFRKMTQNGKERAVARPSVGVHLLSVKRRCNTAGLSLQISTLLRSGENIKKLYAAVPDRLIKAIAADRNYYVCILFVQILARPDCLLFIWLLQACAPDPFGLPAGRKHNRAYRAARQAFPDNPGEHLRF